MVQRGFFLLLTQDDDLASTVSEPVQRYSVLRRVRCEREAASVLRGNVQWSGMMLDLQGSDEEALTVAQRLREAAPRAPTLALVPCASAELVNGLHACRVELVVKPVAEINLVSFVERALVSAWLPDERVAAWVNERARVLKLTAREVQLMAYTFGDESRQCVMRRLGVSENTLKTQVRALLKKFGARSLDHLAKMALREALILEGQAASSWSAAVELDASAEPAARVESERTARGPRVRSARAFPCDERALGMLS